MEPESVDIPVIDFSLFLEPASREAKLTVANDIVKAFKAAGFLYLSNHGVPETDIQGLFTQSSRFFCLPVDKKEKLAWEDPRSNRGYSGFGRERSSTSTDKNEISTLRQMAPDNKESMEIGRDWDPTWRNMWPDENDLPGFKTDTLKFYEQCHRLHVQIMRAIALGLQLEETFFDGLIDQQCHNLRLQLYPAMETRLLANGDQARVHAHTDYGSITLVFQDNLGGLEVQNPANGNFVPVHPIPNTIVVNCADLLARWSNDTLRSSLHQVVAPPAGKNTSASRSGMTPARQSIVFFCNPNFDAEIACLPTCTSPSNPPKYEPLTTEAYIVGRLAATYL